MVGQVDVGVESLEGILKTKGSTLKGAQKQTGDQCCNPMPTYLGIRSIELKLSRHQQTPPQLLYLVV